MESIAFLKKKISFNRFNKFLYSYIKMNISRNNYLIKRKEKEKSYRPKNIHQQFFKLITTVYYMTDTNFLQLNDINILMINSNICVRHLN